jgi:hypothetical protein
MSNIDITGGNIAAIMIIIINYHAYSVPMIVWRGSSGWVKIQFMTQNATIHSTNTEMYRGNL